MFEKGLLVMKIVKVTNIRTTAGNVQVMSAGTGHSLFDNLNLINEDEETNIFQIWIITKCKRYWANGEVNMNFQPTLHR